MEKDKKIDLLNDLLAKCYDSEKGYKDAIDDIQDPALQNVFRSYAQQRYDFGHEIKDHIRQLGGEVKKGDTLAAKVHRSWMDLKSTVSSNDEHAILEEAKRGEENALKNYTKALADLPSGTPIHKLLTDQRSRIRQSLNRIEEMIPNYA